MGLFPIAEGIEDALGGDAGPTGAIVYFPGEFASRFLEHESVEQHCCGGLVRWEQSGAGHALEVIPKESGTHPAIPGSCPWFEICRPFGRDCPGLELLLEAGEGGVVIGADQFGYVSQRRLLQSSFAHGSGGVSGEIEGCGVVPGGQDLPESEVPLQANSPGIDLDRYQAA